MRYCHMTEDKALFEVPYVRGLQYIHAALLSQGAHCIRRSDTDSIADSVLAQHSALVKKYSGKT